MGIEWKKDLTILRYGVAFPGKEGNEDHSWPHVTSSIDEDWYLVPVTAEAAKGNHHSITQGHNCPPTRAVGCRLHQ